MAELYDSAVDNAWGDPGDADPRSSEPATAIPLRAVPALSPSGRAALPPPPAVIPESTNTFAPLALRRAPSVPRAQSRNDATLIVRPLTEAIATPHRRSRIWLGLFAASFLFVASMLIVVYAHRGGPIVSSPGALATKAQPTKAQPIAKPATPAKQRPATAAVAPAKARPATTPSSPPAKQVATRTATKSAAKAPAKKATAKAGRKPAAKSTAKPKRTAATTKAAKPAAKASKSAKGKTAAQPKSSTAKSTKKPAR